MKGKKWAALLLAIFAGLAIAGCGNRNSIPTSTNEEIPSEKHQEETTFGIEGLRLYEGVTVGENLQRSAVMYTKAHCEEGFLSVETVHEVRDGIALCSVRVCDTEDYYGFYDEYDEDAEAKVLMYLANVDVATGEVKEAMEFPKSEDGYYCYPEVLEEEIWFTNSNSEYDTRTCYNRKLEQTDQIILEGCGYAGYLEGYGFFYIKNNQLLGFPAPGNKTVSAGPVALEHNFRPSTLANVFYGSDGLPYALIDGIAGDLKEYRNAMFRLDTGELVGIGEEEQYFYSDGSLLCWDASEDSKNCTGIVTDSGIFKFNAVKADYYPAKMVLKNGNILFYLNEFNKTEHVLHLQLFDGTTGEELARTQLSYTAEAETLESVLHQLDASEVIEGDLRGEDDVQESDGVDVPGSNTYITGVYQISDGEEESLGLCVSTTLDVLYYKWDYTAESKEACEPLVEVEPLSAINEKPVPEMHETWDATDFSPENVSEDLSDLRQQADELEEKFGIRIRIEKECKNILGGYAMTAIEDRQTIKDGLDTLDAELSKYPEGFLKQIRGNFKGLVIYLSGPIIGTDDTMLSSPGGFRSFEPEEDLMAIVVDSSISFNISSAIHHELSHAIEQHIEQCSSWEAQLPGCDQWNELNPGTDGSLCYTLDYMTFGTEEFWEYTMYGTVDNDKENVYFADNYSLTYPTEDMATIFQLAMETEGDRYVEIREYPHLQAKLQFFSDAMRTWMDLPEETTYWERNLK